ncbi:MAG: hydantoinase/oxoprolinase family protein [Acidimicrobiia bacterium]|nr:hydantoinase/oxoprolinase family protein [Acidimicrobiia bacterium]MYF83086.1 hydantoinase/oxoprolinase family protein [Acidimicrobiia bacterium]
MYRIAVDVGGTFTDCLVLDEQTGDLRQFKSPTTPPDPSIGCIDALAKAATAYGLALPAFLERVTLLIHGTTLATNTLINEDGARTGMITTRHFRDMLEIRRGYKNVRTSMYNVFVPPYKPLIPRRLRLEAEERVLYTGEVHKPLNEDEVREAARQLGREGIESVAIGFLHAYANTAHERRAAEIVEEELGEDVYVTTSSQILPVWREWERFSTMAVSAYTGPAVKRYLLALEDRLAENGFAGSLMMMLSDGLVETVENCIPRAVYLIGSGPAAAPAAAVHLGSETGHKNLLSFDMGGTSIDIGVVMRGEIPTTTEGWVQDERVAIKMVDIVSAGAGGGSIAWVDSLGLLRVGPNSAGGDPGPACYAKGGTAPTVTDADLVLGYIDPDFFLGGEIPLDPGLAVSAIVDKVADPLGMTVEQAAEAIMTAVSSFTADEINEMATRRGIDVRDLTLVAGGGAGPAHAAFIADILGLPHVIVPSVASTYSAFGMFAMDVGRNYARSYITRFADLDTDRVQALYEEMEQEAITGFGEMGYRAEDVSFARTADLRYIGQFHEVEVEMPLDPGQDLSETAEKTFRASVFRDAGGMQMLDAVEEAIDNFHAKHYDLYTFNMPWQGVELLTFRLRATVPKAPFELHRIPEGGPDPSAALKSHRDCWFGGERVPTPIFDGGRLKAGNQVVGPAIIEEPTTTVVVPGSFTATVDAQRSYHLNRDGAVGEPTGGTT